MGVAAELTRKQDNGGNDHDVEHQVLDDGDDRRRTEAARIGVRREDKKSDRKRPLAVDPDAGDDDAYADKLESDVGNVMKP